MVLNHETYCDLQKEKIYKIVILCCLNPDSCCVTSGTLILFQGLSSAISQHKDTNIYLLSGKWNLTAYLTTAVLSCLSLLCKLLGSVNTFFWCNRRTIYLRICLPESSSRSHTVYSLDDVQNLHCSWLFILTLDFCPSRTSRAPVLDSVLLQMWKLWYDLTSYVLACPQELF